MTLVVFDKLNTISRVGKFKLSAEVFKVFHLVYSEASQTFKRYLRTFIMMKINQTNLIVRCF